MIARLTHRSGELPPSWLRLLALPDAEIAEVLRITRVALALLD